jgi:TPR repeat protein
MKCNKCGAEWTLSNSTNQLTDCPFCGEELAKEMDDSLQEVSMATVLKRMVDEFGVSVISNSGKCISLFKDFAPGLQNEQRLLKMALQNFEIGTYFLNCAEKDRTMNIHKAINAMEGMVAEEAQKTIITSFVYAFGWDEIELKDYFKENNIVVETKGVPEEKKEIRNKQDNIATDNDAEQLYQEGLKYYNAKDYTEALKRYSKAATQGHADAQNYLGVMYQKGFGVELDYIEAVKWYYKAAEQGNTWGQWNLGMMYCNGRGVERNDTEGVKWFREAAVQGHANAQFDLGAMYSEGRGVAKDYEEAVKWYYKAAEQGNANAQCNLGWMYSEGHGVAQDYTEAVKWYYKAAEQGNAYAQNNLGMMYLNGRGVAQDYTEAVKWFREAAIQGHAEAQTNLGWLCYLGRGVEQNNIDAFKWSTMAAEQGNVNAQNNLGLLYMEGRGTNKNYDKAIVLFRKADAQGNIYSPWNLGSMYENGWGVKKDIKIAKQWYERAAARGHADAKKKLEELNKSGCFITTAVCDSLNKPDDCDELMTMRWYRDKIQSEDKDMAVLIREYYRVAPMVVKEINRSTEAKTIYKEIWEKSISGIYQNIKQKEYWKAALQYMDMLIGLCKQYNIPLAPSIKETIETVRTRNN